MSSFATFSTLFMGSGFDQKVPNVLDLVFDCSLGAENHLGMGLGI